VDEQKDKDGRVLHRHIVAREPLGSLDAPVCRMYPCANGENDAPNARLIAAAPQMLEALEDARKSISDVLDNCPYFFPVRGIAANLTPEQSAWRKKVQGASTKARAALSLARGEVRPE
jgi:hypothetical protein